MRPSRCREGRAKPYPERINTLPRDAFDYVWLIDLPEARWNSFPGLTPIWTGGQNGILYRVDPVQSGSATKASETPAGSRPRTAA